MTSVESENSNSKYGFLTNGVKTVHFMLLFTIFCFMYLFLFWILTVLWFYYVVVVVIVFLSYYIVVILVIVENLFSEGQRSRYFIMIFYALVLCKFFLQPGLTDLTYFSVKNMYLINAVPYRITSYQHLPKFQIFVVRTMKESFYLCILHFIAVLTQ